jgi:predicted DNA-binding transcriptional regulator
MEAGTATEAEIGIESVSDMDLAGRENELRHLNKRSGQVLTKEKFFYQFGEQLKGLFKLIPDKDFQYVILDGGRYTAEDVLEMLKEMAGYTDNQPPSGTANDENEIRIYDWMTDSLRLSGNELLVYALIFSLTKDGKSGFHGIEYIEKALNVSRRTVFNTLKSLMEKELLQKTDDGQSCYYTIPLAGFELHL